MSIPYRVINTETGKVFEADPTSGGIILSTGESFMIAPNGDLVVITVDDEYGAPAKYKCQLQAGSFKDKNGNQLWEGDHIRAKSDWTECYHEGTIVWQEDQAIFKAMFMTNGECDHFTELYWLSDITRVGNVLLKESP